MSADQEGRIKQLTRKDAEEMLRVINEAARRYEGEIPADCYSEPYMPRSELEEEKEKMRFLGYVAERLIGVIGLQTVGGAFLIRHLYVLPEFQRRGIGTRLLDFGLERATSDGIYVGTWEDARWAVEFYKANGFETVDNSKELLREYWDIPERQVEESVVLRCRR
ncbi:hypothetical protein AKJ64_03945 [candidate division MSBL1 archaeon SCGC-AAA259E17]|uniref:N-acetyltransferase domain-containing protein n=1 Tax=candidate division MSBL1 archaeon SCGC-AAA259E17 TaxID=1698263 RepID=A0A133UD58_9EURY|nr:hypothetical protein AKJ64_03945 [candidate division MSBL1 archaeon SCGC-AAA259E17]